ncbi:MAG: diacylglycerol/lipid kinase family protein [Pseudomonadota bacterium]
MTAVHAIVNPHAAGGETGRIWPEVRQAMAHSLGPVSAALTRHPGHATTLAREALMEGATLIVAVGGDGTVSEVVNGFFTMQGPINPQAVLAVVNAGTGGDFARTFGIEGDWRAAVARLAAATPRKIDLARVSYTDHAGMPETRYFDNIASFGMSGAITRRVNAARLGKRLLGRHIYAWHGLMALLAHRNRRIRLRIDDGFNETLAVSTVAIANGRYFGGGMMVAPQADPCDGLLDVIILHDMTRRDLCADPRAIYAGRHLDHAKVQVLRGARIEAVALDGPAPVMLEVDGETPGRLDAVFEVVPQALSIRI